jgi:transcriptional regulator with XRE-family HTH domain
MYIMQVLTKDNLPMDARSIAARLRARREYLKRHLVDGHPWTQEFVAERIGMSEGNYSRIEKGAVDIPAHELPRYAKVLLVPLNYFFDETYDPAQRPYDDPAVFVVREEGTVGVDRYGNQTEVSPTLQQQMADLLRAVNTIQSELREIRQQQEDREKKE